VKLIDKNFVVVSDYNWLPENLEDSWVDKWCENYLIYDRYHRFPESNKVKHQKNVGQNHYDMFDFIINNYENLPDSILFCRACLMFPKDIGTPRYDENGKRLSTGNCTEEFFLSVANNTEFTEIQDFTSEPWRINGIANRIGPDNSYMEQNNSWYFEKHAGKYYTNLNDFLKEVYVNPPNLEYVRFSPGGNYIIPKRYILKYSKKFYEYIRSLMDWTVISGEIHMIERITYHMFVDDWEVVNKYKK
jgi:hypothetical protein